MTREDWREFPYNMSTQEIEEELAVLTDGRPLTPERYHRIGQLEMELQVREYDQPVNPLKEIARD